MISEYNNVILWVIFISCARSRSKWTRKEKYFLANPECTITTQNLKLPLGNLNIEK